MKRSVLPWLAASLLVLVAAGLWMRAGRDPKSSAVAPDDTGARARGADHDLAAAPAGERARTPSDDVGRLEPSPPAAKPAQWGTSEFEVRVVRDEDGTPIAGAEVSTGWLGPAESRPTQTTDADGTTRWRSNGGLNETILASAPGRAPASERVTIHESDPSRKLVLRLEAKRDVHVRLVDARGDELSPTALGFDAHAAQEVSVALSGICGEPGGTFDSRGAPKHRAAPESWTGQRFAWRVEIRDVQPTCVHAVVGDMILASQRAEAGTQDVALVVDPALFARASSPFVVRVISAEDGAPIANASVTVAAFAGFERTLATDAGGRARFERVLAGEFDVSAVAPGRVRQQQRARRPLSDEIEIRLAPGRRVEGLVVDAAGRPVPKARLAAYAASGLGGRVRPIATAESDAEGRFAFAGIPGEAAVVCALGDGEGAGFLPPRENLPTTCAYVEAGGDATDVSVRAFEERWLCGQDALEELRKQ